jgi:hypothetical protein
LSKPNPLQPGVQAAAPKKCTDEPILNDTPKRKKSFSEQLQDPTEEVERGSNDSDQACYESSDNDEGLVKYCGSNNFRRGGERSGQDTIPFGSEEEEEDDSTLPALPLVGPRGSKRFAAVAELLDARETKVPSPEESQVVQKRGRRTKGSDDLKKFWNTVEKAVVDILGPLCNAPTTGKAIANCSVITDVSTKRGPGRATTKGKGAAASFQAPKVETRGTSISILQTRDASRRLAVGGASVPMKFRGLA